MGDPTLKADHPSQKFMLEMLSYIGLSPTSNDGAAPEETKSPVVEGKQTIPWGTRKETVPYLEGSKPSASELGATIPAIFKTFTDFLGQVSVHDTVTEHLKNHPAFEKLYKAETVALDPVGATLAQYGWEKEILDRLPKDLAAKSHKEIDQAIEQVVGEVANVKFWGDALREVEGVIAHAYGEIGSGKLTLDFGELEDAIHKTDAKKKASFGDAVHEGAAGLDAKAVKGEKLMPSAHEITKVESDHEHAKEAVKEHDKPKL